MCVGASVHNISYSFSVPIAVSLYLAGASHVPHCSPARRLSLETTQTYYTAVVDLHNSKRRSLFFSVELRKMIA